MRVGIANAEQASLGFITKRMLDRMSISEAIARNVALQVPTGDLLANEVQVGALDAAIVYSTNALTRPDQLEALAIDHPAAKAVQPFAVAKDSPNHRLAERLLAHLQRNRSAFTDVGFHWREEQTPVASGSLPAIGGDLDAKPAADGTAHAR
jgi:ABC-type molybdate transport system substrate-binding protein